MTATSSMNGAAFACRSCHRAQPELAIDLGSVPASDYFPPAGDPNPDPAWPLRLYLCPECTLIQLGPVDGVVPEAPTAVESATALAHASTSAHAVIEESSLRPGQRIIEIDSHHGGSWLDHFVASGLVAVPPDETADLVVDVHALVHSDEIDSPIAAHARRLAPGGKLVIEFHHVLAMVEQNQIDTVRHGHWVYSSVAALEHAFGRHGLTTTRVAQVPVFGGSLRLTAQRIADEPAIHPSVGEVLAAERTAGLYSAEALREFGRRGREIAEGVREHVARAQADGRTVAAYGAPSKATVLLTLAGLDAPLLPFTADLSPAKQGCRIPGTGVVIRSPAELVATAPDEVIILTWDIADEVVRQLGEMASRTSWRPRFVIPLPELRYR